MIKQHISLLLLLSLCFSCHKKNEGSNALIFKQLFVDSKQNSLTVESERPLFSWLVEAKGYNKSQSTYHILVASSEEKLNENDTDLWNSKKVKSAQSAHVKYQGKALKPMQKYFWKVRIWDETGQESSWSPVQNFKMGLIDESNWGDAKWISLNKDTRTSEHRFRAYKTSKMEQATMVDGFAAGYFRNLIHIEKEIASAQTYICGLGYYELFLNGNKVGDQVLDPAPSNYDKQAYYVNYDITEQLKTGKNALGIILGNGFYGQNISWKNDPESQKDLAYGPPAVRLLIKLHYKDGSKADFYTDETWKEATGPIVFNNIYGGDTYDARYELNDWSRTDYSDEKWEQVKIVSPELNKVSAQQIPPIKKLKVLDPQKVFKATDGNWIVDFGQNIAGWVQLNVKEKAGQLIEITTTEALLTNGKDIFQGSTGGGANGMPQLYKYICKGNSLESWEPKFSYHGFRYAKIKGISSKPDKNMIKAVLVATDIQEKGIFVSSDSLLNKMHNISKWTIVDNLHGIPEDCPHREKCGWLGDAHAFCEYALYNYDMFDFYKKYMEDIRTQMRPTAGHNDPDIKYQVPTMIAPGKRTSTIAKLDWGIATIYLPWYHYLYYGDQSIVSEYYEDMKQLTQYYLSFKNETGIIDNGMGDWCPPRWDRKRNPGAMECHPVISATAYFYDILKVMKEFSILMNDTNYKTFLNNEIQSLKKSFNATYLTEIPSTKHQWYGSQTATVMALQFGLVPDAKRQNILNGLIYDINVTHGGHHSVGIHGNRYLYTVLSKLGQTELGYSLLTNPEFPSQAFIMNSGFTTWPERQWDWSSGIEFSNSLNHPMHSGFAAYFYESIGGIQPITKKPGFKEFTVQPIYPKDITTANVKITTPYGEIKNDWKIENKQFTMNLSVPFNTTAIIPLSDQEIASLKINNESAKKYIKNPSTKNTGNIRLESGTYTLSYSKK